jgi:hypothetical protein
VRKLIALAPALFLLLGTSAGSSHAAESKVKCTLSFVMKGWAAFFSTASGEGSIKCNNGQTANVKLEARGGGLTAGKSDIDEGYGEFSSVVNIDELMGSYVSAEAHAGAVKSAKAQVMTKGEVSLALSGKGRGWDLGITFGKLTIAR